MTTKGKIVAKVKQVSCTTVEESLFLDDLIRFMVHAKAQGTEELFSYRKANGDRVCLTGRSVREEVKSTCALYGLDPECSALIPSVRVASRIWDLSGPARSTCWREAATLRILGS